MTNDTVLKDVNNTTYNFVFDKTETAYQYYKLEITSIQSGDVMQMSEFALTDCNHSWYTSKTEPTCTTAGNTTKTCTVCKGTDSVYLKPVEHDFTGEGGKCKTCGYTADELYVDENGMLCPVNGNTKEITEGLTAWNNTDTNGGWYIVKKDVTLNSATVSGNVHLILADGCNLKVNGDITGGSLTIYGQSGGSGSLTVSGSIISGHGENGGIVHAGSTGLPGGSGGNLTINGGMIKATSIKSGNGGDGGTAVTLPSMEVRSKRTASPAVMVEKAEVHFLRAATAEVVAASRLTEVLLRPQASPAEQVEVVAASLLGLETAEVVEVVATSRLTVVLSRSQTSLAAVAATAEPVDMLAVPEAPVPLQKTTV